jgi:hypothetical protein
VRDETQFEILPHRALTFKRFLLRFAHSAEVATPGE